MADQKLSELTAITSLADTDLIYVTDYSTSPISSKKITYANFKTALLARANHTGTQAASTISDFDTEVSNNADVTANTAKISADNPAMISALDEVTVEGTDYVLILDTSVSPNALKKILASDLITTANATHTGDATGDTALTLQPVAISGKGAVTVASGDLLGVVDVSASPQVLGQVTAQSVADLATPEGTAIKSTGETGGTKYLREDGDGTCSWQTVAAGTGDLKADGTVPLTADWDAGGFEIRALTFESDATTGTAPFTVASTTVVTNLNADLLDGNEATAFATAAQANATHTGDATGATALTLQPAAITGKGAVTVDGADLLLVTDVSASPQVLGQVTAQSIANLAPAVQGSAILSSDTSPLVTDGYVLTADGAGGAAWEAAAGGGLSNVVEDTTPQLGGFLDLNGQEIRAAATSDAVIQLADNAGTYALSIQDSDSAEVSYIDSEGRILIAGTVILSRNSGAGRLTITGVTQQLEFGSSGLANDYISLSSYGLGFPRNSGHDWSIGIKDNSSDAVKADLYILGQSARAANTTNVKGGDIVITAGASATGSGNGGDVIIRGGTTTAGSVGLIIMDNLPTSDPGVSGALYKELDATTSPNTYILKVSA